MKDNMSLEFVLSTSNWVNTREWKGLTNECVKANITENFFGLSLKDYFLAIFRRQAGHN